MTEQTNAELIAETREGFRIAIANDWARAGDEPLAVQLADRLEAAEQRPDREPSNAAVEAGCVAFYEGAQGLTSWERLSTAEPALADRYRDGIRAALHAAQEVRDVF